MGGSKAARARIAVDLPVPRSPSASTPPMLGSTAQRLSDRRSSSWPTIAVKGKTRRGCAGAPAFLPAFRARGLVPTIEPSMLR